jgi:hypothetical protein
MKINNRPLLISFCVDYSTDRKNNFLIYELQGTTSDYFDIIKANYDKSVYYSNLQKRWYQYVYKTLYKNSFALDLPTILNDEKIYQRLLLYCSRCTRKYNPKFLIVNKSDSKWNERAYPVKEGKNLEYFFKKELYSNAVIKSSGERGKGNEYCKNRDSFVINAQQALANRAFTVEEIKMLAKEDGILKYKIAPGVYQRDWVIYNTESHTATSYEVCKVYLDTDKTTNSHDENPLFEKGYFDLFPPQYNKRKEAKVFKNQEHYNSKHKFFKDIGLTIENYIYSNISTISRYTSSVIRGIQEKRRQYGEGGERSNDFKNFVREVDFSHIMKAKGDTSSLLKAPIKFTQSYKRLYSAVMRQSSIASDSHWYDFNNIGQLFLSKEDLKDTFEQMFDNVAYPQCENYNTYSSHKGGSFIQAKRENVSVKKNGSLKLEDEKFINEYYAQQVKNGQHINGESFSSQNDSFVSCVGSVRFSSDNAYHSSTISEESKMAESLVISLPKKQSINKDASLPKKMKNRKMPEVANENFNPNEPEHVLKYVNNLCVINTKGSLIQPVGSAIEEYIDANQNRNGKLKFIYDYLMSGQYSRFGEENDNFCKIEYCDRAVVLMMSLNWGKKRDRTKSIKYLVANNVLLIDNYNILCNSITRYTGLRNWQHEDYKHFFLNWFKFYMPGNNLFLGNDMDRIKYELSGIVIEACKDYAVERRNDIGEFKYNAIIAATETDDINEVSDALSINRGFFKKNTPKSKAWLNKILAIPFVKNTLQPRVVSLLSLD